MGAFEIEPNGSTWAPPVRLTVFCASCGFERTTLAMHSDAVRRAAVCERCSSSAEIVRAVEVDGIGRADSGLT